MYDAMNHRILRKPVYLIMSLMAAGLLMTSCEDNDDERALTLDGIWQGTIAGGYYNDRFGFSDQWDTEMQFVYDSFAGGYGTEVDYAYNSGYYYPSDFTWEVRDGYIYLYYADGYDAVISDYELYSSGVGVRFRGYFDDLRTGRPMASFDLVKVANWSDWSRSAIEDKL